jgi:hypothetical protein
VRSPRLIAESNVFSNSESFIVEVGMVGVEK